MARIRGIGLASQTGPAGVLIFGATAALFGLALGIVDMSPAIPADSDTHTYLLVAVLLSLTGAVGSVLAYLLLVRQARARGETSGFEQGLQLRNAALSSMPAGILAVLVGLVWYVTRRFSSSFDAESNLDTLGVAAFAGAGAAFLVTALVLAVVFERRAIRRALEDLSGVGP